MSNSTLEPDNLSSKNISNSSPETQAKNETELNETPAPKITNTCWSGNVPCPDGTNTSGKWCTSGYSNVKACNTSYIGDTSGIPEKLLPLTKFKCYWEVKKKFGYGAFFDPTSICSARTAGWAEACACSDFIERFNLEIEERAESFSKQSG